MLLLSLIGRDSGYLAGTASGKHVPAQFSSGVAQRLSSLGRDAFVAGLHTSFRFDAALALCALLVAVPFVGGRGEPATEPSPAPTPGLAAAGGEQ